jgi:hypothetical protein
MTGPHKGTCRHRLMVVLALFIAVWACMFAKGTWFGPCTLKRNGRLPRARRLKRQKPRRPVS